MHRSSTVLYKSLPKENKYLLKDFADRPKSKRSDCIVTPYIYFAKLKRYERYQRNAAEFENSEITTNYYLCYISASIGSKII